MHLSIGLFGVRAHGGDVGTKLWIGMFFYSFCCCSGLRWFGFDFHLYPYFYFMFMFLHLYVCFRMCFHFVLCLHRFSFSLSDTANLLTFDPMT